MHVKTFTLHLLVHWKSDIDLIDTHALPVVLSQCVLRPVLNQVALANR